MRYVMPVEQIAPMWLLLFAMYPEFRPLWPLWEVSKANNQFRGGSYGEHPSDCDFGPPPRRNKPHHDVSSEAPSRIYPASASASEARRTARAVIAGDFVDFLAIPSYAKWTPEPSAACQKLEQIMSKAPFAQVFDALRELVAVYYRLTIIVGNHDVEMALPQVQEAFLRRVGASAH